MKYLFVFLFFLLGCNPGTSTIAEDQVKSDDSVPGVVIVTGTRIYFSQKTFPSSDFRGGLLLPNVSRKLSPEEEMILDSVVKGYFGSSDSSDMPKVVAGCYWPKHAVQYTDSTGYSRTVNICFECGQARSDYEPYKKVSMLGWEIFFKKMGWPVRTGYQEFFDRARNDTVFSKQKGTFNY